MELTIVKILLAIVTVEIGYLLSEREYCHEVDRYDEIEKEIQELEWAEESLCDEINEIEYHE